jgi:metal-responsive CopG/Arc/MetJ family transcriptional regulator
MKKEGKVNISITLDSQLLKNLEDFCQKNYSVRSKVIDQAIKDFLEKRGKP